MLNDLHYHDKTVVYLLYVHENKDSYELLP